MTVQGSYIGDIQLGTFQTVPNPDANILAKYTKQAIDTMIYWLLEETPLKPEGSYVSSVFREILYFLIELYLFLFP